jgi:N-acetylmuramoyl-L-alanine amidase
MSLWIEKIIPVNKYSRPGLKLYSVKKIVMHYTANPGASAYNHYLYFKNLKDRYASAHIFVDKTEAYQIIPLNEVAYHANDGSYRGVEELKPNANFRSIGVELCIEKDGTFHPETIKRAAQIVAYLCEKYQLDPINDVVRHYDVTHKNCPAPWVKDEGAFTAFKNSVKLLLNGGKTTNVKTSTPSYKQQTQTKNKTNLTIDGKWGSETTKALQKALGTVVDGVISSQPKNDVTKAIYSGITFGDKGSMVIRALQKKIGAKVNGKLDSETIRKLQKYLGTPIDGKISRPESLMVKELQRRLNKGTF